MQAPGSLLPAHLLFQLKDYGLAPHSPLSIDMLARWVRLSSCQRPTWYNRKRAEHGIWSLASEDRFKAKLSRVEKPEGGGRIPRRGVCVSAEFVGYGDVPDPFRGVFTQIYTFVKIHQRALEICVCYLFLFLVAAPGPGLVVVCGLSLRGLLLLQSTASGHPGFSSCGTQGSSVVPTGL